MADQGRPTPQRPCACSQRAGEAEVDVTRCHPKMRAAIEARDTGDFMPLFGLSMRARALQDEGLYCECAEPYVFGEGLMCLACLRNNRDQEVEAVRKLISPHAYQPNGRPLGMCAVCAGWENDLRHSGGSIVGRTSWGAEVRVDG